MNKAYYAMTTSYRKRLKHQMVVSSLWLMFLLTEVSSFIPNSSTKTTNPFGSIVIVHETVNPRSLLQAESEGLTEFGRDSGHWKLANDFNFFLNQCAIQSLLFLMNSLRDRHTALWLEEYTHPIIRERTKDPKKDKVLSKMAKALTDATHATQMEQEIKLLKYHGLGAINTTLFPTWESYFEKLLKEPGVTYSIESSRPHVPDYELEINPASLCSRIISVREQISLEFAKDLDVIADMSGSMLQNYFDKVKTQMDGDQQVGVERPNLLFLEIPVDNNLPKPSPLRKGNFDLLTLLTTQESIHRILNDASKDVNDFPDRSSVQFLRNFYTQRIGTHFTGSTWYGRADDFLEELLTSNPCVTQLKDEECGLVDPIRVAELILNERERVALEWLEIALDVPMSHSQIKRWQLNRLMGIDTSVEGSFE